MNARTVEHSLIPKKEESMFKIRRIKMGAVKDTVLQNLKTQWKIAVEEQYKQDLDKMKNANIDKNANDIINNPMARGVIKKVGITKEDVVSLLTEIRDEICKEESK